MATSVINSLKESDIPDGIDMSKVVNGTFNVGYIKNLAAMGITPATNVDTLSVTKNMAGYQQYENALLGGNSSATTLAQNGAPLGNRKFEKQGGQCMDNTQQVQERSYVVDGMAYLDGDTSKTGLMYSAYQTIQDSKDLLAAAQLLDDNKCVKVKLIKNSQGDTESGYISTNEYNVWKKKQPSIFAAEGFEVSGRVDRYNIQPYYSYVGDGNAVTVNGFFNDQIIDANWLLNPMRVKTLVLEDDEESEDSPSIKLNIDEDIVTGFFLGSITVLSLFLIYRLFDRMPRKLSDN
jgi:hypothetical protein